MAHGRETMNVTLPRVSRVIMMGGIGSATDLSVKTVIRAEKFRGHYSTSATQILRDVWGSRVTNISKFIVNFM